MFTKCVNFKRFTTEYVPTLFPVYTNVYFELKECIKTLNSKELLSMTLNDQR